MNSRHIFRQVVAVLMAFQFGWCLPVHAALTDISNTPLSAPNSSVVRPNLMFVLDDSGSMEQDYTPDAAAQNYLGYGSPDKWCYDSGDDGTLGTLEASTSGTNRNDICRTGDVPYFSPDTNYQYYNPDITYSKPFCYNGACATYPDMTPTAAKTDGYGVRNKDQHGNSNTTRDLTTQYPERVWCDSTGATATDTDHCKTNTAASGSNAYLYPSPSFSYGKDGSSNIKYKYGAPFYYRLKPTEYCTTSDLTICVAATSATNVLGVDYTYPATIRWCENATQTDLATTPTPSAADKIACQARYDKYHTVPRYLGVVNPASSGATAKATFNVTTATSGLSVNSVTVDGVNIINTTVNATGSTSSTAQAICNAINTYVSTPDYTAGTGTSSTACTTSSATINVAAATNGTTANGYTIAVSGPGTVVAAKATGTITVTSTGATGTARNSRITDIKVGTVSIVTGPLNFTDGTNTSAVASSIASAINSKTSSPEFTATAAGDVVTITATATGSGGNGTLTVDTTGAAGAATRTLTYNTVNSGTSTTSVKVGSSCPGTTTIMGATVNASGSTSTARKNNMASGVRANINTLTGTTGYSATVSTNVVTISAPTGSFNNGRSVCVSPASTSSFSYSTGTFSGGRDAQTTTNTNMTGGVSLSGTIATTASSATFAGGGDASTVSRTGTGTFERVDIVPSTTTYPKAATRTDCGSGSTCTYDQELQNFANWYSYYRTRMNMMKTAVGHAFYDVTDEFRVGFITINVGSSSSKYLPLDKYDATQKQSFYSKLYAQTPSGSTPLREALSRVGRYYGGKTDGINAVTTDDPIEYECQQCYTLLTTDGFWNGNGGQKLDGTAMGNQDTYKNDGSTLEVRPYTDGGVTGATDTLADTADYYYNTDLRSDFADKVPRTDDKSIRDQPQHMVTYTLGLGVNGNMIYQPDYTEATTTSDYRYVREDTARTSSNCSWQTSGTNCEWPLPVANDETAVDDLWHAGVNGHGKYFSARDPSSLSSSLQSVLDQIRGQVGAAAAAATSNANIKSGDNFVYSATFTTVEWTGEVIAQEINITTGDIIPTPLWSAQAKMSALVSAGSDTRTIYTFDSGGTDKLKPFTWGNLNSTTEQPYFSNGCVAGTGHTALTQCVSMTAGDKTIVNNGEYMVNFLRGQSEYEDTHYRNRTYLTGTPAHRVLGDAAHSTPAYVHVPLYNFSDAVTPSYTNFKNSNASRQEMLYIAANDGFLHAFNAANDGNGGTEVWAYAPRMVFPNMYQLADKEYDENHRYYVDGSPSVMDMFDGTDWRTILVGGLGGGGRGYYALDITDPAAPKGLWEMCSDSTLCALHDDDLGLTYGNPIITKLPTGSSHAGDWVAIFTSGYNNASPGDGEGHLYVVDVLTGALLYKVDTGAGSATTPSGLAKIAAWADDADHDNTAKWVYGGDLLGNIWKFDLSKLNATDIGQVVVKLGVAKDSAGVEQAITTRPELGKVPDYAGQVLFFGTGRYLGACDVQFDVGCTAPDVTSQVQSVYAFKDLIYTSDGTTSGTYFPDGLRDASTHLVEQTLASDGTISKNPVNWGDSAVNGWYVDLSLEPGERVDVDPQLVLGTLVVIGNIPATGTNVACAVGGTSFLYQLDYATGGYLDSVSATTPVRSKVADALTVGVVVYRLPDGSLKSGITDAGGTIHNMSITTGGGGTTPHRSSWREIIR